MGLAVVGPKLAQFVDEAQVLAANQTLFIYCWRGGMRSNSMALLLATAGFRVNVLTGGYKAFRNWALEQFSQPRKLVVLGGYSGTGKTELLAKLANLGAQTIDLEAIACHQGSAFGKLYDKPQPGNEQFENELAMELSTKKTHEPLFVEDESVAIGIVRMPSMFYSLMQRSPLLFLNRDYAFRLQHVIKHYGNLTTEQARAIFNRLQKRMGGQQVQEALNAIAQNNVAEAANIALRYYDKNYYTTLTKRSFSRLVKLDANLPDVPQRILRKTEELTWITNP
jgi:tRNA 2-selenouridine synthase